MSLTTICNKSDKRAIASFALIVTLFIYVGLMIDLDSQFTPEYSDKVAILKLENITANGADVVYVHDGVYTSSYYAGKIQAGTSAKEATVEREVSKNMRGIENITLRNIVIPDGFIK